MVSIGYFNSQEGVQIQVVEFTNFQDESANILTSHIVNVLM